MLDTTTTPDVVALADTDWTGALAAAGPALPFAEEHWLRWGFASAPGREFTPVAVRAAGGTLLLPLVRSGVDGQLGGFGYGMVTPAPGWSGVLPGFDVLADAVCAATGLRSLRTLLPPLGAVPALDSLTGDWSATEGRPTYLLDLAAGTDVVWQRARGSVRTAVRRAAQHGVSLGPVRPDDAAAVHDLYRETLSRNGHAVTGAGDHLAFLAAATDDVVAVAARGADGGLHAVSAFAVGEGTAFHVLQVTSAEGRDTNAGHAAFHAALDHLAARGAHTVDLGSATSGGQERFKLTWGADAHPTRVLAWPGGAP